uniref:Uncharacterized protein n=1 Tax=Anguilla anguilla TaxID=7936 RepID=A0A0E9THU0_ANGAN
MDLLTFGQNNYIYKHVYNLD